MNLLLELGAEEIPDSMLAGDASIRTEGIIFNTLDARGAKNAVAVAKSWVDQSSSRTCGDSRVLSQEEQPA